MERILYGVSGVGIGHAIRSKVVICELLKKYDMRIVASGFSYDYLKGYFKDKVININGFEMAFRNNKIDSINTILNNMKKVSFHNYLNFLEVGKELNKFNPSVVISDWEPYSSFYSFNESVPLIIIGNAHFLAYGKFSVKLKHILDYIRFRFFLRTLIFPARYYIINCLPKMKLNENKKIRRASGLIRDEIFRSKPKKKDYVFVYQSTDTNNNLIEVLMKINEKFIIYGFSFNGRKGNLVFKKFDDSKEFIKDFVNSKAVISNGGFTLISEAIYLQKPMLLVPIKHHYEQILNAQHVFEQGFGEIVEEITVENVWNFLDKKYKIIKSNHESNNQFFKLLEGTIRKCLKK